jgi:Primase C terminal 2 (PriCT-2)/RepB DNA-primase from phage plasmid
MAFDGVAGVNLYAQYGTMSRDLAAGKKGGERDVDRVFAAVADIDNDKLTQREIPVEPSYVIESSPGNFQRVYIFPNPLPVSEAKPVLCAMHAVIGGDSAQRDCSHVWRIPGTLNWPTKSKLARGRSPEPVQARIASPWQGVLVDPKELLALAPPTVTPRGAKTFLGARGGPCDDRRLHSALSVIPADDRDIWLRVGMALHSEGHRRLWDEWSQTSSKFDPATQDRTWNSFHSGGIALGTVFYEAKMRGWR